MKKINNSLKGFMVGVLITSILLMSIPIFADGVTKTLNVLVNSVKVQINDKTMATENLLYNNKVYIDASEIAALLGKEYVLDNKNKLCNIRDKTLPIQASGYIFRKVNFGMTKQEIIKAEGRNPDPSSDEHFLVYKLQLDTLDIKLSYMMNDKGQLFCIMLELLDTHTNNNNYIDDYHKLTSILTEKYGNPDFDKSIWKNDLYKKDPQRYGTAVSVGHLYYVSNWDRKDYFMGTVLYGDNFEVKLGATIESKVIPPAKLDDGI